MTENWKRTLYIMVFVQLVSAIGMSSVAPFLPLYVESLGNTTALDVELLAGLVFSAQAFTMMLAAPVWGALADRHGRKPMVVRATLGGAVIIVLMAFVQNAEQLVMLRAVQGLVTGVLSAVTALVASIVPRERAGYALGMLQVGLWGGISVGPLIGGVTADSLGYRAAFIVTAALLAIAGVVVWRVVEEEFTPVASPGGGAAGFASSWRHVVSMPGVSPTYAARFLCELGRTVFMPFTPFLVQILLVREESVATLTGMITGLSALAGTGAAIYLGRLGDRVGHKKVLIGSALGAGLFYLPQSIVSSIWQLILLQGLTGFAVGGLMPTLSALLAGFTDPGEEGAVYGLEGAIQSAGRTIAPVLGAGFAAWFGVRSVFAVTGVIFLALALVATRSLPQTRRAIREPARKSAPAR